MGSHLEIYKTKKSNITNNILLVDDSFERLGDIDCSYSHMNNYCKDKNIIEVVKREKWDDYFYHIADSEDIKHINKEIINDLNYNDKDEVIIVVYDNA